MPINFCVFKNIRFILCKYSEYKKQYAYINFPPDIFLFPEKGFFDSLGMTKILQELGIACFSC